MATRHYEGFVEHVLVREKKSSCSDEVGDISEKTSWRVQRNAPASLIADNAQTWKVHESTDAGWEGALSSTTSTSCPALPCFCFASALHSRLPHHTTPRTYTPPPDPSTPNAIPTSTPLLISRNVHHLAGPAQPPAGRSAKAAPLRGAAMVSTAAGPSSFKLLWPIHFRRTTWPLPPQRLRAPPPRCQPPDGLPG